MDSNRDFPSEFDPAGAVETAPPSDVAAAIGTDERRMHVRAYNHWVSLLDGRDFPSIEDLEPSEVEDFAAHSVLLDFTCGRENPAVPYVGSAIREECAMDDNVRTISDVPARSLLSRLTDHYMQIIANRSPVGFEAEFDNPAGDSICYRGILMPFSSDGDGIDFIYGVINWKHVDEAATSFAEPVETAVVDDSQSVEMGFEEEPDSFAVPVDIFDEEDIQPSAPLEEAVEADQFSFDRDPLLLEEGIVLPEIVLDESAGLADRLWAARETAESVKAGEGRTRAALYDALALAYDFAVAAKSHPEDYAELLEESGVKAQVRAPMTPIVKLVFGIDYDKARLTEFAAALSYAERSAIELGGFKQFIGAQAGGLKGLVAAERVARRPADKAQDRSEVARAALRNAQAFALADIPDTAEFALVLTRLGPDGVHQPIALVDDPALVERAIRRAA
jgi:hypothetical protein